MNSGVSAYRKVGAASGVQDADPHRLIQMLMRGLLDSVHGAEGQIANNDLSGKLANINRAVSIIDTLRSSLDFKGGELAQNLDALYEYMASRLVESNASNDVEGLREVAKLIEPIKAAWDEIRPQVQEELSTQVPSSGPRPGIRI